MPPVAEVFVGVGSNIDPGRNVRHGLHLLDERFGRVRRSPVYRSRAVGFNGDDFLNLVVAFETGMAPPAVVQALRCIESHAGRQRDTSGLRSRTLDLDLLLYGAEVIEADGFRLPRPEILEYAFVLKPLADMVGEMRHPELGRTFSELWAAFDSPGQALTVVNWED